MTLSEAQRLVKSKQRVADHGEVFTPAWMVEDMLDLVKRESERIDSRVLEPAFMRKSDVSRDRGRAPGPGASSGLDDLVERPVLACHCGLDGGGEGRVAD